MKKRAGLNVVNHEGQTIAQLYNTVIFVQKRNGDIVLNRGSWITKHTKHCINDMLPPKYYVYQKNFVWYVKDRINDTVQEFKNNMILKGV